MGVTVETIRPGDGVRFPKPGHTVTVHYVGTLADGSQFDSSRDNGEKFSFVLGKGEVIQGWDEGVARMSLGEARARRRARAAAGRAEPGPRAQRARLTCSPDFGYGARGYPPVIPPNAVLYFDVELFSFS